MDYLICVGGFFYQPVVCGCQFFYCLTGIDKFLYLVVHVGKIWIVVFIIFFVDIGNNIFEINGTDAFYDAFFYHTVEPCIPNGFVFCRVSETLDVLHIDKFYKLAATVFYNSVCSDYNPAYIERISDNVRVTHFPGIFSEGVLIGVVNQVEIECGFRKFYGYKIFVCVVCIFGINIDSPASY